MLSIPFIQPSVLLGLPLNNFKSSKPYWSASPFGRRKNKKLLVWTFIRDLFSAIAMARFYACQSPHQNPSLVNHVKKKPAK